MFEHFIFPADADISKRIYSLALHSTVSYCFFSLLSNFFPNLQDSYQNVLVYLSKMN